MGAQLNFFQERLKSFRCAVCGLRDILTTERNAWVHAAFTLAVFGLSAWLEIEFVRLVLIVVVISLVWITEAFNTVLEIVIDIVSPQYTEAARRAKDIAAAAVLCASFGAAIAGTLILGPPLVMKLGGTG